MILIVDIPYYTSQFENITDIFKLFYLIQGSREAHL